MAVNKQNHKSSSRLKLLLEKRHIWFAMLSIAAVLAVYPFVVMSSSSSAPEIVPPGGSHNGENVEQPIEFPHNTHVKDNGINCMYCHTYARRSKVAGIPPTSKCMGCHKVIATDKPRIQKLTEYWEQKSPPPWKKVHDVPDFVHFTHEKHLKRFVFDQDFPVENVKEVCAFCHGDVENMTVAHKVKPLNMGWCKTCHINNGGPGDCWACHK
ncbi:MAG: cytochrome c family protein [Gammaproteobacteria bacterium]|nr:cytochrome c family protein [Gammaproteobacteria bacterium]